jgi:predicted phage replisome organizer
MAEIKWIKITTNMFDDEKIKLIDAMPERDTIFYIWMRLLVQAGKTNAGGYIFLNENVPYTEEMLSTIFNRPLNSVRLALNSLKDFGMIEVAVNHLIKIANWEKHQNIEGMEKVREQNRLRKQKQRSKVNELTAPSNTDDTKNVTSQDAGNMSRDSHATEEEEEEEEIEEEIDKDKEIEEEISLSNKAIEICKHFETISNGKSITQYIEDIKKILTMHPYEWILEAVDIAVKKKAYSMVYIERILQNWASEGKKEKGENKDGVSGENNESSPYDFSKFGG